MKLHGVPFIAAPNTAAVLKRIPASRGNYGGHDVNENKEVYKENLLHNFSFYM